MPEVVEIAPISYNEEAKGVEYLTVDYAKLVPLLIESIKDKINVNDFSEIIFLCKYVGDYNITKFGDKLTFENSGKALLLKRIV